ncbi:thioredoxin domain-containing protein [Desulfotomaculum defluvii]
MILTEKPNRLINEKSPYLLQHAHNPVDWFSWGEDAFAKAKKEDKPIFLSVGYSTCHWCHVMERESFESEDVADVLNQYFISIKVDREERPDIDQIYMNVCQALTGSGGWPLTIIMTPNQKPFFAGTYFPKTSNYGRPGLIEVLEQISGMWQGERSRLLEIGDKLTSHMQAEASTAPGQLPADILEQTYRLFEKNYDKSYGGFGNAPKFPTPHNLMFLLRYWYKTGEEKALDMVAETLDAMHRGGIYDHIGFGFARYSTDKKWLVPHFEKMLYDNALLAFAFMETYQITKNPRFGRIAKEIFTYILRDMTSPEGGFYSAEDADSEGVEGKFYVWQPEEVIKLLGPVDGELFCRYYDITTKGNFEGASIPNLINQNPLQFAEELDISLEDLVEGLEKCRKTLFEEREKRIHPYKDDKILTSWNGLMIAALAKGAQVFQSNLYLEAAEKAMDFIFAKLQRPNGRLLARYREGEAAYQAYLDDYAFIIWALLELYQASFEPRYLQNAVNLTEAMLDLFYDNEHGGFYFYGKDSEELFSRPKDIYDGAIPSGNSVATVNLLKLARLTESSRYGEIAKQQLQVFAGDLERYPAGYSFFMMGAYLEQEPPMEIVVAGPKEDPVLKQMVGTLQQSFLPNASLMVRYDNDFAAKWSDLLPLIKDKNPVTGKTAAYVCKNFSCQAPVTELTALQNLLKNKGS